MITADDLLRAPSTDPTSVYRYRDGLYASDLLTAAVCHLDFFNWLNANPGAPSTICRSLGLHERPVDVMLTLFTAMGLVRREGENFSLTELAKEHLCAASPFCVAPYFRSVKDRPVCLDMVEVLRTGKPSRWASLRNEQAWAKAMENPVFASQFTAAMDCRGAYLGPALAQRVDCAGFSHLLDVGGGSGIYACAWVARHAHLRATVLDKPPVDRLASRSIAERGFDSKVRVLAGDMFRGPLPEDCDIHLFSNVLHDWDAPQVKHLVARSFAALPAGGMIVIHDAHVNAAKTGPLPVAAYSALLMTISEGKCYSVGEMTEFLTRAGFERVEHADTVADRSVITARKPK
ncbi:MAG TPA: methyltransferase [Verrucomicrobiae bacterium]|nr:methyltransferase [Verrucomicrobiae bacterium]